MNSSGNSTLPTPANENNDLIGDAMRTDEQLTNDGRTAAAQIAFQQELKDYTDEELRGMLADQAKEIAEQPVPNSPYALLSLDQARMIRNEIDSRQPGIRR